MQKKVFVLGGVSYNSVVYLDKLPDPVPKTYHTCIYNETIGSTGAGKALNLCKLNFDVSLHANIGLDEYGQKVNQLLKQPNLHFFFDIDPLGTQRHINILDTEGNRISVFITPETPYPIVNTNLITEKIANADFVVLNILNYARNFYEICKNLNKPVWTDLHDYPGTGDYYETFINHSDYIFLSSDNLPDYKKFMEKMHNSGKKLVICTHGKNGATAVDENGTWYSQPVITDFVMTDANGAGDSFFAGFLYGYAQGYQTQKCLQTGTLAAGLCIESKNLASEKLNTGLIEKLHKQYFNQN